MKPGTIVRLPDGREGTVVYHSLCGYGIVFGRVAVDVEAIKASCPLFDGERDERVPEPEALLREPWKGAWLPCVGESYEVVE
jgi:hypothetical protein